MDALQRMEARINDACKRWDEERAKLEAEIKDWRSKMVEQCFMTLAAQKKVTRQRGELNQCIRVLTIVRANLQQPVSIQERQHMLELIDKALNDSVPTREK